ncbi:hypothetical protein Ga0466249_002236 [Sporomusaceae bacterium BoRhaA]|uniref:hypothetical protein n=1 Tax=Pelorhabdus rhamnosifermentans TaxID=2772457 RepID=UPI001C06304D|nr:hypothetical protein [Pelorhabdus rhamnosifermentans]MBU2701125.1 hypothetical protein [Pelorhabdus rhamnosifermentans]
MIRKWTEEELEFLDKNKDKPSAYIAKFLNRSANSINSKRNYEPITKQVIARHSDTPERRDMFKRLMYLMKVKSLKINGKANINWDKFKTAFGQVENMMGAR